MPWKLMARDLLLIIYRIEWTASCIDNMNNRYIFFKKCVKSLKILLKGSYIGKQVYIYRHVSIPGDLCHSFLFSSEQNDDLKITV